ncbi:beta-galactosidase [Dactylosporangium sp. CA-139066]|uniref:beta-galactosidase n=1 Tax=Dactylosporangium sp. CA-139066 TaxID=3239930 RepID=UPI003D8F615D
MLRVRRRGWPGPAVAAPMPEAQEARAGLALTDRHLLRDGRPWIPVSGELHYSRVPRGRWRERLELMRAGGVTVVSTYVPWNHHEPRRGEVRFDGGLDVGAFIDAGRDAGLEVVLRIGPWVHGELRNGGFPDWVQRAPVRHRTDDPAYVELVRAWFARIGAAVGGRELLAIQLENELLDAPGHLVTLKGLARASGLAAPLWTATAWDGARLPPGAVMPVYSGYADGFWTDADAPWDPAFRAHFFFSDAWDPPRRPPRPGPFPPATCELGGGMATAYHRRPRPSGRDVAAVALCKIGSGSVWQGFYMYCGGTNPPGPGGTQESHATGYPNDVPRLGYDFHAPIGEAGVLAPAHAELRRQHAFLAAFGADLAREPAGRPDALPAGVGDGETLRWAVRGPFLFIAWHQPHVGLPAYRGARFRVDDAVLPSRPLDIPPGTLAAWPVGLDVHGVRVDWATASALTVLPGPTLVLCAEEGIPVEIAAGGAVRAVEPGRSPVRLDGRLDVLVLPPSDAATAWVTGDRRLLLSGADLRWGADGRVVATGPDVQVYDPSRRAFRALALEGPVEPAKPVDVAVRLRQPAAADIPAGYGSFAGRPSAPSPAVFDELAAVYALDLPAVEADALLWIDWAGDVAELRIGGRAVTDRFWDGSRWVVSLRDAGYAPGDDVTLHVLPLAPGSPVNLPADARRRARAAAGPLLAVDRVRLTVRRAWREAG